MNKKTEAHQFLPTTEAEMKNLGWEQCDFIIITGDAYVDHPTFGAAVIGRVLEKAGFKSGIIAQPDWQSNSDFQALGKPRLAFLITSGNLDSMVARYTAAGKPRSDDAYTPGGMSGKRPDRAVIVYTSKIKGLFRGTPVIIGGIEASLRRLSHYDYWSDKVRRSILLDAKADLLIYGMAERSITETAKLLERGIPINETHSVPGTVYAVPASKQVPEGIELPAYTLIAERDTQSNTPSKAAKRGYAESFFLRMTHENPLDPKILIEPYEQVTVVQNPPQKSLTAEEFDAVYSLPFTREPHPRYGSIEIPALKEVKFSIISNRGCFGDCSFCAITAHQGRTVQVRSHESVLNEIHMLASHPDFKGYIHDIGGPTANFQGAACRKQLRSGPCEEKFCLFPEPCGALLDYHKEYLSLLNKARRIPKVKKVFIRSGIRYDYLYACADSSTQRNFIRELAAHHVSGQLKVAPEHVSAAVLDAMGKPEIALFNRFSREFLEASKKADKKQYIIPYFISGHPGSTLTESIELAEYLRDFHFIPDQVQDFYPTPGTVSTCMYFSQLDPRPGKNFAEVYVPKGREKRLQRALIHFHKPENRKLVIEALKEAGRTDLIGPGHKCLISSFSAGKGSSRKKPSGKQRKERLRR